jgi:ribosomal protein S18 acetylase RimI-like enzyme
MVYGHKESKNGSIGEANRYRKRGGMDVNLRPMRPSELVQVCDEIASLPRRQRLGIASEQLQKGCQLDPDRTIYVVEVAGELAGCIMFRATQGLEFLRERVFRSGILYSARKPEGFSPAELPNGAYVNMLAVFGAQQGRGIGQALLNRAEEDSAQVSDRIYLCVSKENPRARAFYEREGYTEVAEARDCVRMGNIEHLMVKELT